MNERPVRATRRTPDEAWHGHGSGSGPAIKDDLTVLLLGMPCHKETILPELRRFFATPERGKLLKPFLQQFAGVTMTIPTPKQLKDYERDEAVVAAMRGANPDPGTQVQICMDHQITYRHLQEIHKAVFHRDLHAPPTNGTKAGAIEAAGAILNEYRGSERVVAEMFGLNTNDMRSVKAARGR